MRIAIASDHAGFEQKQALVDYLAQDLGCDVTDFGPDTDDRVDYPDYAEKVAHAVASGDADRGVLVCGTGIGMALAADKVPGVRAGLAWSQETARLTRAHNDANVVGIGARMHTEAEAFAIVDAFLAEPFSGEARHQRRIDQVAELER